MADIAKELVDAVKGDFDIPHDREPDIHDAYFMATTGAQDVRVRAAAEIERLRGVITCAASLIEGHEEWGAERLLIANQLRAIDGSDDEQVHANTRLIAMAPELYERLEATVYALEKLPITGAAAGYYKTLLREAKEVLAKARGEKL